MEIVDFSWANYLKGLTLYEAISFGKFKLHPMTAGCVFFFLVAYVGYMMYDWILGSFGKRIQRSSYDHP